MRDFKERKKPSNASEAFFQPQVQKKLSVGKSGDKYEKEADHLADKVVNQPKGDTVQKAAAGEEDKVQQKPLAGSISSVQLKEMATDEKEPVQKQEEQKDEAVAQKKGEEEQGEGAVQKQEEQKDEAVAQKKGEEEQPEGTVQKQEEQKDEAVTQKKEEEQPGDAVQKKEEQSEEAVNKKEEEEKAPVQQKAAGAAPTVEARLAELKGKGQPLPVEVKQEMEGRFGVDFSKIRVHTDAAAVELCKEMGAQAFTHGNDIYFNEGKFNPHSKAGKHLLAHELTHTVQQKGGK